MKMHIFCKNIIDLKGHRRSQKVKIVFKNYLNIPLAFHLPYWNYLLLCCILQLIINWKSSVLKYNLRLYLPNLVNVFFLFCTSPGVNNSTVLNKVILKFEVITLRVSLFLFFFLFFSFFFLTYVLMDNFCPCLIRIICIILLEIVQNVVIKYDTVLYITG